MPKSKRKPISLKRPKRTLPKNREGGVNPLLVAGGAAAGYKAGSVISNRRRESDARKRVGSEYATYVSKNTKPKGGWDITPSLDAVRQQGAQAAYKSVDFLLPEVDGGKYDTRKKALETGMSRKEANKYAGVSRREEKIISNRRNLRNAARKAKSTEELLGVATKRNRYAYGTSKASKGARVGGALSGAAITAIAQLVAAELRKKR